jgi:hypothetical protein
LWLGYELPSLQVLVAEYERVVGVRPKLTVDPEGVMEAPSCVASRGA